MEFSTNLEDRPAEETRQSERLLAKPEVLRLTGVSYPTIWSWMREGKFPRSRKMGTHVRWLESEVQGWIAGLPIQPLKGDGVAA
jgi:prophage regulatory protein